MRYGKPIKNKKRSDPRYFLNEQDDEVYQDVTGKIIQGSGGAGSEVMFYDEGGAYTKDDDEIAASMEKFTALPSGWQDRVSNTLVGDAAEQYAIAMQKKNLREQEADPETERDAKEADADVSQSIGEPPSVAIADPMLTDPKTSAPPAPEKIPPKPTVTQSEKDALKQVMGQAQKVFVKIGHQWPAWVTGANTLTEIVNDVYKRILKERK